MKIGQYVFKIIFLTNTKQKADPKSSEKNIMAEVINSSANKRLDSPKEKYIIRYSLLHFVPALTSQLFALLPKT